jgi:hypothetical protein
MFDSRFTTGGETKMETKGTKIEGIALITAGGITQGRRFSLEVPYINVKIDGASYSWVSENAAEYQHSEGQFIKISAFARDNGRLYKVRASF